jgi:hypothetical protein
MLKKQKGLSKKVYLAIILLVVLVAATVAIILATQPAPIKVTIGVHVGDTFTYSLKSASNLGVGAVDTPGFSQYNETDYYKVTITDVNVTSVSLDTVWRLLNGTETVSHQTIDLSNGAKTDDTGFWAIYASNLKVSNLLRPTGLDGITVNMTDTQTFANSVRERNYFQVAGEFFDVRDPTHNTLMYDSRDIYFDKQTGILTYFVDYQEFNNPQMIEVVTWTLVDSNVWAVQ